MPIIVSGFESELYNSLYYALYKYFECEKKLVESEKPTTSVISWFNKNDVTLDIALDNSISAADAGYTSIKKSDNGKTVVIVRLNPKDPKTKQRPFIQDFLQTLNHEIQLHVRPYMDAIKLGQNIGYINDNNHRKGHPLNYETQHDHLRNRTSEELNIVHELLQEGFPFLKVELEKASQNDIESHISSKGFGWEGESMDKAEEVDTKEVASDDDDYNFLESIEDDSDENRNSNLPSPTASSSSSSFSSSSSSRDLASRLQSVQTGCIAHQNQLNNSSSASSITSFYNNATKVNSNNLTTSGVTNADINIMKTEKTRKGKFIDGDNSKDDEDNEENNNGSSYKR